MPQDGRHRERRVPMQARLKLLQEWSHELRALLPGARATRVATLAAFSLGGLWAGSVGLVAVAQALPLPAADMSTERRLRRWLANRRVSTSELWDPLAPRLLARYEIGRASCRERV